MGVTSRMKVMVDLSVAADGGFFFDGLVQPPAPHEADESKPISEFLSTKHGLRLARSIVRMSPDIRNRIVDLAGLIAGERLDRAA